ncbi:MULTISPECIES: SAM-dependent methyltransferase [Streptomyces]|uniref:SAM-dependent methyltransferase n=1 Tax=Streptomyces ramulosus TaxID=47762 RepID=A0ABW1FGR3_9ACTN
MTHTASSPTRPPTPEEVGASYDELGPLFPLIFGRTALHIGQWSEPGAPAPVRDLPELSDRAMDRQTDWYTRLLAPDADTHVLDIGCGTGGPALRIARRTGARVTGITISRTQAAECADRAREAALTDRVTFDHGDAMNLPYRDGSFGAALAVDSLCHMHDRPRALAEARRVLRPGGRLLLTEFTLRGRPSREQLAAHHGMWISAPLVTVAEVLAMAEGAGWEMEQVIDDNANMAMTGEVMALLYRDRHDEVLDRLGAEATARLDASMPLLRSFNRDHLGHAVFLLRRP